MTKPALGNEAIGLILASYSESLFPAVNLAFVLTTVESAPLLNPAGANHGYETLSLKPNAASAATEAGKETGLPVLGSVMLTSGKYVAE